MTRSGFRKNAEQIRPHWLEWLTGLFATLIVITMIGWIVFEAWTTQNRPPELSAHVLNIQPVSSGWRVMVEIRNAGDQTAAGVEIKGALLNADAPVEEVEATFDYVAAGSTARGGLLFVNDPSRYRLRIVPSGFTDP